MLFGKKEKKKRKKSLKKIENLVMYLKILNFMQSSKYPSGSHNSLHSPPTPTTF